MAHHGPNLSTSAQMAQEAPDGKVYRIKRIGPYRIFPWNHKPAILFGTALCGWLYLLRNVNNKLKEKGKFGLPSTSVGIY